MTSIGGTPVITSSTDRAVSQRERNRIRCLMENDPDVGYEHRSVPTPVPPRILVTLQPDRPSPGSNRLVPRQP